MDKEELLPWFEANKTLLENAYVTGQHPWQQSGFGLHTPRTYADWHALRKPVADCIEAPGTFLDIGCANGFLLECVLGWTNERGVALTPFGLDISEKMVALAKKRLPHYASHIYAGNAWDWDPPRTFDYVRTELVYVPEELHGDFVRRIMARFLSPGGRLLVAEYRSTRDAAPNVPIDTHLTQLGYTVIAVKSGLLDGKELTRIAVVQK